MNSIYFQDLSLDEQTHLDGGLLTEIIVGVVVTVAYGVGTNICEDTTGKSFGDWITYGVGCAFDKVAGVLSDVANFCMED